MSWLIEAYLEEGKHGPDHPESLEMRNMDDMRIKKYRERQEGIEGNSTKYKHALDGDKVKEKAIYNKVSNSKEADIAGKKAILRGDGYLGGKEEYVENKTKELVSKTNSKQDKNRAADNKMQYTDMNDPGPTIKSVRRHDEKLAKAANESVDLLVELM